MKRLAQPSSAGCGRRDCPQMRTLFSNGDPMPHPTDTYYGLFPDDDDEIAWKSKAAEQPQPPSIPEASTRRSDDVIAKCKALYEKNVERAKKQKAMKAKAPEASPTAPGCKASNLEATAKRVQKERRPSSQMAPAPGRSRGKFIAFYKKEHGTWRVQIVAFPKRTGVKGIVFRFQLWTSEQHSRPIPDGPGCGFSLRLDEAESLAKALLQGLEDIRSGAFDPDDPENCLPGRKGK